MLTFFCFSDGIIRMESPSSSPISVRRGCENDALDVPRQNGGQHSHQNHHHHNRSTSNPRKNHPSTIMTSQSRQHCRDFVTSISPKDGCKHKTNLSVVVMQPPPTTIPSSNDFVRSDSSTEREYLLIALFSNFSPLCIHKCSFMFDLKFYIYYRWR